VISFSYGKGKGGGGIAPCIPCILSLNTIRTEWSALSLCGMDSYF